MAPSLGELDVDHPALPPGSRSIEHAIKRRAPSPGPRSSITHYRILSEQQPAATLRLVAKDSRLVPPAYPRRARTAVPHSAPERGRVGGMGAEPRASGRARCLAVVTLGFGVGDVKAVETDVALPASGRREADPQPQHDLVPVMGDELHSAPVGSHDHPDRTRAGDH